MNLIRELRIVNLVDREARQRAHVAICESKLRFPTKKMARAHCKRMISSGCDPRVEPYECPVCRKFHIRTKCKR